MNGIKFGRVPSSPDERDWQLRSFMPVLPSEEIASKIWKRGPMLNQGNYPHCTGFSAINWWNCEPLMHNGGNADGHAFYAECKKVDEMPGVPGSTIRAVGKVLRAKGWIDGYAFAANMDEVRWWLLNRGPVIMGTDWTSDMYYTDPEGYIWADGITRGGHAWLVLGFESEYDRYIGFNQWPNWGYNRTNVFYLESSEMQILMNRHGEALAAVELEHNAPGPAPISQNKGTKSSTARRRNER